MRKQHVLDWIHRVSRPNTNLLNFPICPYAQNSKYEIIETSIQNLIPDSSKEVIIFIVEDELELPEIEKWVDYYNEKYPEWDFFEDTPHVNHYINSVQTSNGKYNLILAQPKILLRERREALARSKYYSLWEREYLEKIMKDDVEILDK
jgi:hypothetical protein